MLIKMQRMLTWLTRGSMSEKNSDQESLIDWTIVSSADEDGNPNNESKGPDGTPEEEQDEEDQRRQEELQNLGQKVEEIKGDADGESVCSDTSYLTYEERVRKKHHDKSEATQDEETDLSLASSPSLPDNLPQIKPEAQYIHIPHKDFNKRLHEVMILVVACVVALGIGHYLGCIDHEEFELNLNAAKIIRRLADENSELQNEIFKQRRRSPQQYKIIGKDGKESRQLREDITKLISEIEEMRKTQRMMHYEPVIHADDMDIFHKHLKLNHEYRITASQLWHLDSDVENLKKSLRMLKEEKDVISVKYAQIKFAEPMPTEIKGIETELDSMKKLLHTAISKQKPSPSIQYAKAYLSFMSQIMSSFDRKEPLQPKVDVFNYLITKSTKLSPLIEEKIKFGRLKLFEIQKNLRIRWKEIKDLSDPSRVTSSFISLLNQMNRVLVNVVHKLREVGQSTIIRKGKNTVERTVSSFVDKLRLLSDQFTSTWEYIQNEATEGKSPVPLLSDPIFDDWKQNSFIDGDEDNGDNRQKAETVEVIEDNDIEDKENLEYILTSKVGNRQQTHDYMTEPSPVLLPEKEIEKTSKEKVKPVTQDEIFYKKEQKQDTKYAGSVKDRRQEINKNQKYIQKGDTEKKDGTYEVETEVLSSKAQFTSSDKEWVKKKEENISKNENTSPKKANDYPNEERTNKFSDRQLKGKSYNHQDDDHKYKRTHDNFSVHHSKNKYHDKKVKVRSFANDDDKYKRAHDNVDDNYSKRTDRSLKRKSFTDDVDDHLYKKTRNNFDKDSSKKKYTDKSTKRNSFSDDDHDDDSDYKYKKTHDNFDERKSFSNDHGHKTSHHKVRDGKFLNADERFYKGQYNKYKNVHSSDTTVEVKKSVDNDDDDDDDDDGKFDDDRKEHAGLKRYLEKPEKKKSFFRQHSGPKKQFIRRKAMEFPENSGFSPD